MICAVIAAGGSGTRMQAAVKKQFLELHGFPILGHTLLAFDRCPEIDRIVLVLPEEDLERCHREVIEPLNPNHAVQLVVGGKNRQASVRNGLEEAGPPDGTVMIHDGVRPLVRASLIRACIAGSRTTGACIPALAATDTVKQVDGDGVITATLNRRSIYMAQTPQTFATGLIRRAHKMAVAKNFTATDDASVAEFADARVCVIPGDPDNIKITHPQDLALAEAVLDRWREGGVTTL